MTSKTKIDNILKRLDKLDTDNMTLALDFIRDLDHNKIAYRLRVINRLGAVIEQEIIEGIPREHIDK